MAGFNAFLKSNNIVTGTQIPTEGNYKTGDIVVNIGPNSAAEPMWICNEGGNPGVWGPVGVGGGSGSGSIVSINSSVMIDGPTNEIPLDSLGVIVTKKDKLLVHYNSVHLLEGVHFEIAGEGTKIVKLGEGSWNEEGLEDCMFAFELFKGVQNIDGNEITVASKMTCKTNHVIIENPCGEVEIGIEGFKSENDTLMVFKNGVIMVEGVDYTIEGDIITSTGEVWNQNGLPEYGMTFVVFKEVILYEGDSGTIKMDHLAEDVKEAIENASNIDLSGYQSKEDEGLVTNNKTVIGAINELFQNANNGKELIANAIGEPLSKDDTFSAMSNDINSLLATFKTNMMNNGITVESGDKFKSLIDKIATLADSEGKGVQFASGVTENVYGSQVNDPSNLSINVPINLDFEPTYFLICIPKIQGRMGWASYTNLLLSNFANSQTQNAYGGGGTHTLKVTMSDITTSNFLLTIYSSASGSSYGAAAEINCQITWYAIGVGEEDTTLRDSLASILQEEGVSVTEEDDMASLIGKVDSEFTKDNNTISNLTNELAGKVTPAGTAVAANVLSGQTFINSTGNTLTGTMTNNGTKTITPSASAQTLGAGYYDKITINGDADLVAANIVSGKNIFGVTGSAIKAPNVTAGSSYYLLRGVYVSGQHSVDYYSGYIKNGKIYSNQNYIWFRMYFPFSGTISIDYIYNFTDWYNQIKVYNKAGTLVNQTANEKVWNSNTRLTHNLQVEAGGRIDICGYGVDYGTNGADTSTPDSNYLQDLNVKFSLS